MSEMVNRPAPGRFDASGIMERVRGSLGKWRGSSLQNKSMLAIALLSAIVAATVVVMLWSASKSYLPLYGRQEAIDSASVLEQLEKENIPFRLDQSSGQVLVPEDQVAQTRMLLAARGVRAALPAGMETLSEGGLGTSEFMETVRYRHALEGELARTILTLEGVRNARVHLAIPKRTLFVGRTEEKPTGSVMLDLISGRRMDPSQVEAIVNLVAGSVPGMRPDAVAVVDQAGRLLSVDMADGGGLSRLSEQQMDFARKLEDHIKQRAVDMLQPMLGTDNFQIQVAADIDFSAVEETREALDPQGVVQSESGKEDTTLDRLAAGIPGSLSNRPPATEIDQGDQAPGANGAAAVNTQPTDSRSARSEFSRQYENSRSVTHTKYQQGRVKHLSVSVLLNNAAAPAPAKAGTPQQWDAANLAQIQDIVQKAVGFNAHRGDQFSISAFNFTGKRAGETASEAPQWWQQPQQWENYLRYLVGGIIGLTLVLVGVRPLVKYLVRPQAPLEGTLEAKPSGPILSAAAHYRNELPLAGGAGLPDPNTQLHLDSLPEPGSDFSVQLKHLQLLADKETARVAEVIKQWVSGNDRHG